MYVYFQGGPSRTSASQRENTKIELVGPNRVKKNNISKISKYQISMKGDDHDSICKIIFGCIV